MVRELNNLCIEEIKKLEENTPRFSKQYIKRMEDNSLLYHAGKMEILLTKNNKISRKKRGTTGAHAVGMRRNELGYGPNLDFYHKCHLLGEQILPNKASYVKGQLIVGTRYFNSVSKEKSMKYYEDMIVSALKNMADDEKIYYSVIPDFRQEDVIARGVRMIAKSYNSNWEPTSCCKFDVYIYNIYPGYCIVYETGEIKKENES